MKKGAKNAEGASLPSAQQNNLFANTGRTGAYHNDYPMLAQKLCLLGATDSDLAGYFGVCRETIINWKRRHPEFRQAIKLGKKSADIEVVSSLYQATMDRTVTCRQAFKCKDVYYDENGKRVEKERVEIVEVEKHIPADFRSQQFWLRNRNPKLWNAKADDEEAGKSGGVKIDLGSGRNPDNDETVG